MQPISPRFGDMLDPADAEHVASRDGVNHGEVARMAVTVEPFAQGLQHGIRAVQARGRVDGNNGIVRMALTASAAETIFGIGHLLPRIMSAAFSAMAMVGALVFEDETSGMMELSHTLRRSMPCTRRKGSTTAMSSPPILQAPTG